MVLLHLVRFHGSQAAAATRMLTLSALDRNAAREVRFA
jgi:hypothetical protein